jgi:hypothetical protein
MRSYCDGEKFEDNYWSFDDKEGVHQYLYHDKKLPNGYRYAGTRTVKGNVDVPDGFAKIPNKGIMPHLTGQMITEQNYMSPLRSSSKQDAA